MSKFAQRRASYYDDRARPLTTKIAAIERQVQGLDPRSFFRWNQVRSTWELWRWKHDSPIPLNPSADDFARKSVLQLDKLGRDIQEDFMDYLVSTDQTRRSESLNYKELHERLMQEEAATERRKDKQVEDDIGAMVADNIKGMRRDIDNTFSGYYPSTL